MAFKVLYHLWHQKELRLESGSKSLDQMSEACVKQRAMSVLEGIAQGDTRILRAGLLAPQGISDISEVYKLGAYIDADHWKGTWEDAQALVQTAIHLKEYGVRKRDGSPNLDCADFRCALPIVRNPEKWSDVYMGCPGAHYAGDPYFLTKGIHITWEEREDILKSERQLRTREEVELSFDQEILIPRLAKRLDQYRGTKAEALAKFACWKADTEHRLGYWNPF